MTYFKCTVIGSLQGQQVDNCFWLDSPTSDPLDLQVDATTAATDLENAWVSNVLPLLAPDYTMVQVDAVSAGSPLIGATIPNTSAGTGTGEAAPAFVTVNVRLTGAIRGRAYNTRTGLSGIPLAGIEGLTIEGGTLAELQAGMQDFVDDLNALTGRSQLVARSSVVDGSPRPSAIYSPLGIATVQRRLGSQVLRKR
jgi:hypothetical protein